VVQVLHLVSEERADRDRLKRLPALVVQELVHQVGIGFGLRKFLPVAGEDPQLHAGFRGHAGESWHVAPAVGRPLL
jgi:hypothetical protein